MGEKIAGFSLLGAGVWGATYAGGLALGTAGEIDALQHRDTTVVVSQGSTADRIFGTGKNLVGEAANTISDEWTVTRVALDIGTPSVNEGAIAAKTLEANTQVFWGVVSAAALVGSGLAIAGKDPAPLAKGFVNNILFTRRRRSA